MATRNQYRAEWEDGRTLVFQSDSRVSAGEAARSIPADTRVKSIRKIGTVEQPEQED